ncbi:hypothetical protein [Microbulbifer variabilis]|uniref:hypothetical protein n=1 Tax=Microbulbifer variabilis TaxID=266805 RepID=UPI001CFF2CA9|nr:hypothetical protein [Microbulbifer variabilis]
MTDRLNYLELAGMLTLIVAGLHVGCILFGAEWYRFLGAGEAMAQMAEAGDSYPTIVTGIIVSVLLVWSAYAFSGAGHILRLPLLRTGLTLISLVLITRALGFYFIMPAFPDNSLTFWLISSVLCFILGVIYSLGLGQSWSRLSSRDQQSS